MNGKQNWVIARIAELSFVFLWVSYVLGAIVGSV